MRKIPSTMASQHPDHANTPYWHDEPFISVQEESKECFLTFSDLDIDEYKWDWEGKLVDESVMERLLSQYYKYFQQNPIGKQKFLTFRLPNPKAETEFRLARAFIGLLSANALAQKVGMHTPPLFEVILPMTESADEMIAIQEAFKEITELKHKVYKFEDVTLKNIQIIPLFEQVDTIINSEKILTKYIQLHKKLFHTEPHYMRPYLARSDPALNAGLVPTVIAIKIALSKYHKIAERIGIKLYPIIGSAALPFRGGLTPNNAAQFADEYKGIKTALIQSGFRYDYDLETVKKAIQELKTVLPNGVTRLISDEEERELVKIISHFESGYKAVIEEIAPIINTVALALPKRRERVQHIGLFGYSRGVGKVTLPRAIGFTAALYSVGIPPELIGTGRGLKHAVTSGNVQILEKHYLYLREELLRAGRYLNKKNLTKLASQNKAFEQIKQDVSYIEEYVGKKLEPVETDEMEHSLITAKIYQKLQKGTIPTELITKAGKLRRSLG